MRLVHILPKTFAVQIGIVSFCFILSSLPGQGLVFQTFDFRLTNWNTGVLVILDGGIPENN